jgi:hypothetical protein
MNERNERTLAEYIAERNRVLTEMNIQAARELLLEASAVEPSELPSDEEMVVTMHKTRYELPAIPKELREASGRWLQERGYSRLRGLPWPPALPDDSSMY